VSVSDRKRQKPSALALLLRTFFQRYDDGDNPPDRVALLRELPMGSVLAFLTEQALWRTQRNFFGITLLELKRFLEAARREADRLRSSIGALEAEVADLRARVRERS
jgi:hypothetical protein